MRIETSFGISGGNNNKPLFLHCHSTTMLMNNAVLSSTTEVCFSQFDLEWYCIISMLGPQMDVDGSREMLIAAIEEASNNREKVAGGHSVI